MLAIFAFALASLFVWASTPEADPANEAFAGAEGLPAALPA